MSQPPEENVAAVRIPAGENPTGVEIWDCSAYTQTMMAVSKDPQVAANFVQLRSSTGAEYRDQPVSSGRTGKAADETDSIPCDFEYRHEGETLDGPLFKAESMEDKWDIYLYSPYLYFVRSWTGLIIYRATLRSDAGLVRVTQIEMARGEDPQFTRQAVDFLIKSHVLQRKAMHPLPPTLPPEPGQVAIWSFSQYGRRCRYGTFADTTSLSLGSMKQFSPEKALLYGTLVVGLLDGLDAIIFFGMRGAKPDRIFQSIASGLLGRDSFQGGAATAALGVGLHFLIAFGIVLTYWLVSRRWTLLVRRPVVCGLLYGLGAYGVMNLVVLPLSEAAIAPFSWPVLINGLLIHALGVGLPSALFVRATHS